MTLRMRQKVKIKSYRTDGTFDCGIIVGIEMLESATYLGYLSKHEFYGRFTVPRYKVAYINGFTRRSCAEWFMAKQIEGAK